MYQASIEGPMLRFITLDGDPSHAANDDAIRKLVKSNAYRSRKALAGLQAIPNQTASSSVPTLNNGLVAGKSRFALSSRKPLKRVRRQAASYSRCKSNDAYLEFDNTSVVPETTMNSIANVPDDAHQPSHGYSRSIQCQLQTSPASLPPLTELKILTTAQYFTSQIVDMQHLFYDLVGAAGNDDAIFHASLSIASVYYNTGPNDLFHCQKTLSLVCRRLSNCTLQSTDETIGAVGLLVTHNTLTGTIKHATLHMNGLQQIVQARGGLDKLPPRLRRTLSMIDIFYATTWGCSSRFPLTRPREDFSTTLKALLPSLSKNDFCFLKAYENSYSKWSMHGMLQILRILTAVRYLDPCGVFNQLALSEAIYLLEYQLLSPQPWFEPESINSTDLQDPFRLAVFLYIDTVLRVMPPLNIKGLVIRLIGAVRSISTSMHVETSIPSHLDVLLWIIMIGRLNAGDVDGIQYFDKELVVVYRHLNFKGKVALRSYLDEVGPILQPFEQKCEEILAQIENFNHSQL
ncbi:hypothetical protein DL95DRAFT_517576 [Leptodontidium sp. 2 PMI_412]|nr:hypothetical protein DL95DRAFT_517576 [Leptodontidium sp. 2 PMI_412]